MGIWSVRRRRIFHNIRSTNSNEHDDAGVRSTENPTPNPVTDRTPDDDGDGKQHGILRAPRALGWLR